MPRFCWARLTFLLTNETIDCMTDCVAQPILIHVEPHASLSVIKCGVAIGLTSAPSARWHRITSAASKITIGVLIYEVVGPEFVVEHCYG